MQTIDGIPYSHIATLHGADVLATTVLQTCIRYESRRKACKFCAIGQSLAAGRTIARKTPAAARRSGAHGRAARWREAHGDDHRHAARRRPRRGVLAESAFAIKAAVDLPLQGQCEPPDDDRWFERMKAAGIDTLGMHLEAVSQPVRERIMPGKARCRWRATCRPSRRRCAVFGRGQVSTYLLAGLGDSARADPARCASS